MSEAPRPEEAVDPDAAPVSGRAPWLRFAAVFGVLAIASELAYYGLILESETFQAYLAALARTAAGVLNALGSDVSVHRAQISGQGFAVEVAHGCDALQVSALLTSAVIAFPAPVGHKLRGIALGLLLIQGVNLLRIVTLFLVGTHFADVFQTVHEVVWPGALIVITIAAWILWVRQEARGDDPPVAAGA